jgi:hypothetical protein
MKQIVKDNPEDYVFYIKMLPLKTHPAAYKKSKAIVCERSLRLLERAFDGKVMPEPTCETTELDDNMELAERLGITGTPTTVLPDGGLVRGFKEADQLLNEIDLPDGGLLRGFKEADQLLNEIEKAGREVERKELEALRKRLEEEGEGEKRTEGNGSGEETPTRAAGEDGSGSGGQEDAAPGVPESGDAEAGDGNQGVDPRP